MTNSIHEDMWFKDIKSFIKENNYYKFLPTHEMTFFEKLNAIMRFSIYFSIIVLLTKNNYKVLFVPIIVGLGTYILYENSLQKKKKVKKVLKKKKQIIQKKKICSKPTKENPFMNVLVHEYKEEPDKPEGCIIEGEVGDKVDEEFNKNLIRDAEDIYNKNASQRQFYTMPVTSVINNQDDYTSFLYDIKPTCKEGAGQKCEERN